MVLKGINGLGRKRLDALVNRFHTLWSMRHASPHEIAAGSGMTPPLTERVAQEHCSALSAFFRDAARIM